MRKLQILPKITWLVELLPICFSLPTSCPERPGQAWSLRSGLVPAMVKLGLRKG